VCHFHSIIVSTDGRVFHLTENSHSGIAEHYGLHNGPDKREFYECEWDCRGSMPLDVVRDRPYGHGDDVPSLVQRTAMRHYEKLAAILRGELNAAETSPFDQPEYSDVAKEIESHKRYLAEQERLRVEREEAEARDAEAKALADSVIAQFGTQFDCLSVDQIAVLIPAIVEAVNGDAEVIFSELIEEKCDEAEERGKEEGYEDGRQAGYEDATEDMYTSDYVSENIGDFIDRNEWIRRDDVENEFSDEFEEKRVEGFREGFAAAMNGATPAPEFINGLPSFLFRG
jgi:hypothetical protein